MLYTSVYIYTHDEHTKFIHMYVCMYRWCKYVRMLYMYQVQTIIIEYQHCIYICVYFFVLFLLYWVLFVFNFTFMQYYSTQKRQCEINVKNRSFVCQMFKSLDHYNYSQKKKPTNSHAYTHTHTRTHILTHMCQCSGYMSQFMFVYNCMWQLWYYFCTTQ